MNQVGDRRQRCYCIRRCSAAVFALSLGVFTLQMLFPSNLPIYAVAKETDVACYSVVAVDTRQDLPALAIRYGTTVEKIIADNPGAMPIKKGAVLTIRENTAVAAALSRGGDIHQWFWPITGRITSEYGERDGGFHHGIDIAASANEKVRAAQGGKVVKAQWIDIYGFAVLIDHGSGIQTLYAHNSKLLVKPGDWVNPGDVLALAGSTGESTGPHVHFEIRLNGKTIDPTYYLPQVQIVAN